MQQSRNPAPVREAPAKVRSFARRVRDLYVSFLQEGFTHEEAEQMLRMPILLHLNEVNLDGGEES